MELFKQIANKTGADIKEVEKDFKELVDVLKKKGTNEKAAIDFATIQLNAKYAGNSRSPAKNWYLRIVGITTPNYYLKRRYDNALEKFMDEDSRDEAIETGLVDEQGRPVDNRETLSSGKDNKDFGKAFETLTYGSHSDGTPITYEDKCSCTAIGIAKLHDSDDEPILFETGLFDKNAEKWYDLYIKNMYKPITMMLNKNKNSTESKLVLTLSTRTEGMKEVDESLISLESYLKGDIIPITPLSKIPTWHAENQSGFNNYILIRGIVSGMDFEQDYSNVLYLDNVSSEIETDKEGNILPATRVEVPKNFEINFAQLSMVYIIGTTRQWTDKDNNLRYSIRALGMYSPPEYRMDLEPEEEEMSEIAGDMASNGLEDVQEVEEKKEQVVEENEEESLL